MAQWVRSAFLLSSIRDRRVQEVMGENNKALPSRDYQKMFIKINLNHVLCHGSN